MLECLGIMVKENEKSKKKVSQVESISKTGILPVWQPVGFSTYQITMQAAKKFGVKTAHTGVLDPLAEGVIIVLLGDERLKKEIYSKWKKEYEFEVAFGISTDSYDGMGLAVSSDFSKKITTAEITKVLNSLKGKYTQEVPLYSAVKVKGKKLFLYPNKGLSIPKLPKKTGQVYEVELITLKRSDTKKLILKIISNVEKIKGGEFRQQEIIKGWKNYLEKLEQDLPSKIYVAKIKVQTSSGIYIRSLSQDIAKALQTKAFVTKLTRTKNGEYSKKECKSLKKIFGSGVDYDHFISRFVS